jgi:type I restriction enzyme S subunit
MRRPPLSPAKQPAAQRKPAAHANTPSDPRLRFPEFRKAGGWEEKKLGELFSQREESGRTELRLLSLTEAEGIIPQEDSGRKNNASVDKSKYLRVAPGDIAYNTMRMWEGRSALATLEGLVSPAYTICQPTDGTHSLFFSYYFKTQQLIKQFARYSQGLVKDTLNLKFEAFSRILAATPRFPEQHRIAACLSSLDDLLAAERQKLDALKAHKQGLMQQLFPREGETVPRLRFPEFRKAGKWCAAPLGDLLSRTPEYGVNESAVPYSEHLPTYLRITDIDEDGRFPNGPKVSVDIAATADNYLDEGDIVLARTGASVGKSYRYRITDGRLVFAGFLIRIRPNAAKIDPVLLSNFLTTNQYWDWVRITSTRSGQPGLNGSEYASLLVPLPPEGKMGLLEQHRIATCLSSLDDLIAAKSDKLEALKTHKKGLMQQLFPSAEANL